MTEAAEVGADGCICYFDRELVTALRETQRLYPQWTVYPVVPNMAEYARTTKQYGMVGAGINRLKMLGPLNLVRLGLFSAPRAIGAYRRDIGALLPVLVEAEMMAFTPLRPPAVLLHAGFTDLALANKNAALIRTFTRLVRSRYKARPGLMTRNLGHALKWVRTEKLDIDLVTAPANPKGWMMYPNQAGCEQAMSVWDGTLIAENPSCGGNLPLEEWLTYVARHGFRGFTVEIDSRAQLGFLAQTIDWVRGRA